MQGKGIIQFFLVVMTVVCILQYLYILPTNKVENNAEQYARSIANPDAGKSERMAYKAAKVEYLDSMSNEVIWGIPLLKDFTYEELKARQLALGLDLKGGMSVVLQVDLRDFLRALASSSKDPTAETTFNKALNTASERLKNSNSDYITLFADAYREVSGGKKLASEFLNNAAMRDQVNFETSDAKMVGILREKADEIVGLTYNLLRNRIDELGVVQPNISLDESRDMILVELPGISNPERARKFLQSTAQLEFWEIYRISDQGVLNAFIQANDKLSRIVKGEDVDQPEEIRLDSSYTYVNDSLGNVIDSTLTVDSVRVGAATGLAGGGPLFDRFQLNGNTGQGFSRQLAVMGVADANEKRTITEYLERPEIKSLFPKDLEFRWSQKTFKNLDGEDTGQLELFAIKKRRGSDVAPLEGDLISDANSGPDPQTGEVKVSLRMGPKGARIWGDMTTRAAQDNNREIAIVLDNQVVSAPSVRQPILTGSSEISGNFTLQEGGDLAKILQIGKLPAKTKIVQELQVGPSLGAKNISRSITSLVVGMLLVLLFMIAYYGGAGIVSIIALLLNLFFIFGALASYGTVLTLPGIAGIILTIGMAVDANVIIYERVREELREGKSMLLAIQDGFQNSYSAIIDANVTTILTAFVLAYFGLGPIKGFAVVLIIGVLSSLFTAVLIGRLIIDWWTGKDRNISFWTGFSKNAFANLNIDWLGKRRLAYMISGTIIVLGIISFAVRGFELGVDFKGGYSYNIQFEESANISADALRDQLTTTFGATPSVKAVDVDNTYNVTTSYLVDSDDENADEEVLKTLHSGINDLMGGSLVYEDFKDADTPTGTHITTSSKIGPTIADDIKSSSVYATVFALLLIFLYIFIRFSKWQYSMGAVAALFHDVLIVLSIFSIFHGLLPFSLEIDQTFIAAILTVIGYSINDTVVVFDRIREFMNAYTKRSKHEIINMAVNSTISRTVITSLTTLFVVAILFFFGGASIKGFAFALLVGIIVGTYSSVFVATPIMSDLSGEVEVKESKKKSFSRAASSAR